MNSTRWNSPAPGEHRETEALCDGSVEPTFMLSKSLKIKEINGAPRRIRIPNLLIRSQVLYPIELSVQAGPLYPGFPWDSSGR